jgi:glycerol 2-dehydrogenase (NADP+)
LAPVNARPDNVKKAFAESLAKLDIEYIDLYMMHWPVALNPASGQLIPLKEDGTRDIDPEINGKFEITWEALEGLLDTGKVKSIGVANFAIPNLERLLKTAKVVPAVNQVELHRK